MVKRINRNGKHNRVHTVCLKLGSWYMYIYLLPWRQQMQLYRRRRSFKFIDKTLTSLRRHKRGYVGWGSTYNTTELNPTSFVVELIIISTNPLHAINGDVIIRVAAVTSLSLLYDEPKRHHHHRHNRHHRNNHPPPIVMSMGYRDAFMMSALNPPFSYIIRRFRFPFFAVFIHGWGQDQEGRRQLWMGK